MEEKELLEILFAKDSSEIFQKMKQIEYICDKSDEFYKYFDEYLKALNEKNSFIRNRGIALILRNSKWDKENKINDNIAQILAVLDDEKPTTVRICLSVLPLIGVYKKELIPVVREKLLGLNYLKYKESMQGVIKKDIDNVMKSFEESIEQKYYI